LATPAIERIEPFGFAASVSILPAASSVTEQHLAAFFHLREFIGGRDVTTFAVLDREAQDFALCGRRA
jgi:hypothetical protein